MSKVYPVNDYYKAHCHIDADAYAALYRRSIEDNEGFWAEQAEIIDWSKPFTRVKDVSYARDDLRIRWYDDGELNVCYNCVDRHLEIRGDQPAIIWEGDDPGRSLTITYAELPRARLQVCERAESDRCVQGRPGSPCTCP